MAGTNIGLRDWLLGWIIPNPKAGGTGTVGIQAVITVDSTGAPTSGSGGVASNVVIYDSLGNPLLYNANGQATKANSSPVVLASDQGAFILLPGTSRSGTIATGGTAQQLAASNTARRSLTGQNISNADLWVNENGGTAAASTAGSYRVPSGASFVTYSSGAVSIVGATTGQSFTATET